MPMNKPKTLRQSLNDFFHDHLAAVITGLVSIAATAVVFFWVTQLDLVSEVSANSERSTRNERVFTQIENNIERIETGVSQTRVDVAVIREKVENLEEQVKKP